MAGHGLQDMDCRIWIAGHGYGHGLKDMDTDMDRSIGIAGHGHGHELQDMDTDMDCRTWTQQKEFKSCWYIVSPVYVIN